MTESRLATGLLVSAMLRRVQAEGGSAMVIAKGDAIAGAIILILCDRGVVSRVVERMWRHDGGYALEGVGPADPNLPGAVVDYVARRRKSDPDLWVVELDHRRAEDVVSDLLA
jgi:hypothetical protein